MSFSIEVSFNTPSPTDCPVTFTELILLLNALISGELEGDFLSYVTGAATPSVEDQDKAWIRTDAQGRPIGTYVFYSGTWRKEYSGNRDEGRFFMGVPADFFDGTGKGIVGSDWDGFALCNGNNGTPNLSDQFIVIGKVDDLAVGYPGGTGPWTTTVSGESTTEGAGVHDITLSAANTYRPAVPALTLGHWDADGNNSLVGGLLLGLAGGDADFNLIDADAGNPTPPAIPTLPPYAVMAITKWIGYD